MPCHRAGRSRATASSPEHCRCDATLPGGESENGELKWQDFLMGIMGTKWVYEWNMNGILKDWSNYRFHGSSNLAGKSLNEQRFGERFAGSWRMGKVSLRHLDIFCASTSLGKYI